MLSLQRATLHELMTKDKFCAVNIFAKDLDKHCSYVFYKQMAQSHIVVLNKK